MPSGRPSWQCALLLGLCAVVVRCLIGSPYPRDQMLQHAPTVVMLVALAVSIRRRWLSDGSFALIVLFLVLHSIGARSIYSYVPYDDWSRRWLGFSISESFGFSRNHYDRLVHFSFGLLLAVPVRELFLRLRAVRRRWASYFAVEFIGFASVLYELGEWLVAILFAPDWADRYLGQQGDLWDAQKDMGLAIAGAMIAVSIAGAIHRRDAETRRREMGES